MLHAFVGGGQTTTHRSWEPVLRAHQIAQLDVTRGEALILAEDLPPILARQPALYENKALWATIQAEMRDLAAGMVPGEAAGVPG
jgi:type IV secretory pathway TraG/TraD family ATPase VirD4